MLKGHVFSKQLFGNPIFALFINTFLNGLNGVSNNFKNSMAVSFSGSNVTVASGAVCIQGRFLEEDATSTIPAGTENMFCKLVIEINLDQENTEGSFLQGAYKIIKSSSDYPKLTQDNIVKNDAGVYQYELARFKNTPSGITNFQDMRNFLDYKSIYTEISEEYHEVLAELQQELTDVQENLDEMVEDIVLVQNKDQLETIIKNVILEDNKKKYYVGKIILDTKNVNPRTYLGFGTWVLWGQGRVPVGVNTSDSSFNTAEKTGGSKTHAITLSEMYPHDHSFSATTSSAGSHTHRLLRANNATDFTAMGIMTNRTTGYEVQQQTGDFRWDTVKATTSSAGSHSHTVSGTTGKKGSGTPMSLLQPYITCYMWKRTS